MYIYHQYSSRRFVYEYHSGSVECVGFLKNYRTGTVLFLRDIPQYAYGTTRRALISGECPRPRIAQHQRLKTYPSKHLLGCGAVLRGAFFTLRIHTLWGCFYFPRFFVLPLARATTVAFSHRFVCVLVDKNHWLPTATGARFLFCGEFLASILQAHFSRDGRFM